MSSTQLLDAWEMTLDERAPLQGTALLAGCRGQALQALARWSVLERDAALFDLRVGLFGATAVALADCPSCDERLEVALDLLELRPVVPAGADRPIIVDGYSVTARLPSSADLADLRVGDGDLAVEQLLERCIVGASGPDGDVAAFCLLPADVRAAARREVSARLDAAEIEVALTCGGCGCAFAVPFDIGAYLVREVDAWAHRVLREVHALAVAYGWDEPTVLGLSARRRQAYLDLIEAS